MTRAPPLRELDIKGRVMKQLQVSRYRITGALHGRSGRRVLLRAQYDSYFEYDRATYEQLRHWDRSEFFGHEASLAFFPHGGRLLERMGYWPADEELPVPNGSGVSPLRRLPDVSDHWVGFHPDGGSVYSQQTGRPG